MCCEADWKREVVPDHKFDFVNVREFHKTDVLTRVKYIWKYILLLKSLAVYGLDIFTAVTMITTDHWTNSIYSKCGNHCAVTISFSIAKWIFVGCIIFSFLLLGYESWKAKQVIDSRDISYAFTNLMANDYYSIRNYDNFCLFCHIDKSTKKQDKFAFFIYFAFKDWKRLLLADGPRQSINALTLYSFADANGFTTNIPSYWEGSAVTAMLLFSMISTVLIFAGSLILLGVAAVCYVPLLCYIQGNLKEYVCHKVDKRITELIKKKQRQRIARAAALEKKLANGEIRNSKGEVIAPSVPQPTLPSISLDDDDLNGPLKRNDRDSPTDYESNETYERDYTGYPPKVEYDRGYMPYSSGEYGSTTRLTDAAAPLGISYPPAAAPSLPPSAPAYPRPTLPHSNSYSNSNPNTPSFPPSRPQARFNAQPQNPEYPYPYASPTAMSPGYGRSGSGLAYDEEPDYFQNQTSQPPRTQYQQAPQGHSYSYR